MEQHPHIIHLLKCIDLEIKEQEGKYKLDQQHSLKILKSIGVALQPINITRKSFGYADYPEISFRLSFPCDTSNFRDGSAIECFIENEESVKGIILSCDGSKGEFRIFAPDFPDWIEDKGIGIKLAPDHRTSEIMQKSLEELENNKTVFNLFKQVQSSQAFGEQTLSKVTLELRNNQLNESQINAVRAIESNDYLTIVHGPPGTGKTTTLIEGIIQLINKGEKIIVSAPSNTAVDNIAKGLIKAQVNILRVGNLSKVDSEIFPFTSEGKMIESKQQKEIKNLKIRAEELRKMANQYKRRFGKDEREQRNLLIREVKNIRKEIRDLRNYFEGQLFEKAQVILGTPIGLHDFIHSNQQFDTLIIDEAGQCIEPLAWCIFPYAKKWVLAGDHLQLPPTILSNEAKRLGFNISILEQCFKNCQSIHFLNTQYRMRKSIADFSSHYFYNGELKTPIELLDTGIHITFFDTAGTGFEEEAGKDGMSLMNEGEISIVQKIIVQEKLNEKDIAVISPYSGQVELAKSNLSKNIRISTIDSFQGQEEEIIILSLVRSNSESIIGFLNDYRRMNVALTRAKEQLFVIGDSSTIGTDDFYAQFLEYIEKNNSYRSAWELE
ncbi:MAG: AAA family ATPase [Flavobacteriia bacterium]|nr:AAA family ATPase [Flavobacteriia bacterium]